LKESKKRREEREREFNEQLEMIRSKIVSQAARECEEEYATRKKGERERKARERERERAERERSNKV
jgi:hypothetical protein